MKDINFMPQDTRFISVFLGLTGGALDVFSHMQYDSLVATQTGNIVLLISDIRDHDIESTILRCISILFFSIGFLVAVKIKDHAKTAYWRVYNLLPLLITTIILPILPKIPTILVAILAFSTGILMLTFAGSQIEGYPFTILMTSGNYRKMLISWYRVIQGNTSADMKRQAINYSLIVSSFLIGAIASALLDNYFKDKSIWLVSIFLIIIIIRYTRDTLRYNLDKTNI